MVHKVVYVMAVPKAQCVVHPDGKAAPSYTIQTDDLGVARFREAPEAPPVWGGTALSLDCTANGATSSYPIDLTDPNTYQIPSIEAAPPTPIIIPPLTGDLTRYTDNQLISMGYPPPPDPKSHSYETWKHIVTTPQKTYNVAPIPILKDRTSGASDNTDTLGSVIWGGEGLHQSPAVYVRAWANFTVPSITNDHIDSQTSQWVGLGGVSPDCALIQAGIEMDLGYVYKFGGGTFPVQTYFAWIEYFPDDPYELDPSIYPVAAGDQMAVQVWATDANGHITGNGPWVYGGFYVSNSSKNWKYQIPTQAPPVPVPTVQKKNCPYPNVYHGETAEWIIERKGTTITCAPSDTYQGTTGPLTDFGGGYRVDMFGQGEHSDGGWGDFSTDTQADFNMYNCAGTAKLINNAAGYNSFGGFDRTSLTFVQAQ
jgi:hypothetical protein